MYLDNGSIFFGATDKFRNINSRAIKTVGRIKRYAPVVETQPLVIGKIVPTKGLFKQEWHRLRHKNKTKMQTKIDQVSFLERKQQVGHSPNDEIPQKDAMQPTLVSRLAEQQGCVCQWMRFTLVSAPGQARFTPLVNEPNMRCSLFGATGKRVHSIRRVSVYIPDSITMNARGCTIELTNCISYSTATIWSEPPDHIQFTSKDYSWFQR